MHEHGSRVLEWQRWVLGQGPIGRRTTVILPAVRQGGLSSSVQSKGVACGKFMTKGDAINWSVGTRHMLAKASNLETLPLTHTI